MFDDAGELVKDAVRLVEDCPCTAGCPACVGPILSGDEPIAPACPREGEQAPPAVPGKGDDTTGSLQPRGRESYRPGTGPWMEGGKRAAIKGRDICQVNRHVAGETPKGLALQVLGLLGEA